MNLTSSILLRLNISNFWYNKLFIFNNYTKILKLVFNILFYFKAWLGLNNLYSLFYKYLIHKNDIYLISYVCTFLFFNITKKLKHIIKKPFNNYLFSIYIYIKYAYFFYQYRNLFLNLYMFLKYLYFFLTKILYYKKLYFIKKKSIKYLNFKLVLILNLKIKKYIFEFNIFKFFNINVNFFLRNISNKFYFFHKVNFIFLNKLFRYNRYYFLKDLIFIFFISSLYGIKDLFNNFILWNLNWKEKTHYIFLNNLLKILIEFYRVYIPFSKGFLCIVKGKINGISRKRTFKINLGSFGLQYFNYNIIYSSTYQITRFGIMGIKSWFII